MPGQTGRWHKFILLLTPRLNSAKCGLTDLVKLLKALGAEKRDVVVPFFQELLGFVVDNELCGINIRLKAELFRDVPQPNVWLVPVW